MLMKQAGASSKYGDKQRAAAAAAAAAAGGSAAAAAAAAAAGVVAESSSSRRSLLGSLEPADVSVRNRGPTVLRPSVDRLFDSSVVGSGLNDMHFHLV